jgi:hypothetical protein
LLLFQCSFLADVRCGNAKGEFISHAIWDFATHLLVSRMSTLVSASPDASMPFPFYACFSALFLMRDKHNMRSSKSMLGEGFRVACHSGEEDNAIRRPSTWLHHQQQAMSMASRLKTGADP